MRTSPTRGASVTMRKDDMCEPVVVRRAFVDSYALPHQSVTLSGR